MSAESKDQRPWQAHLGTATFRLSGDVGEDAVVGPGLGLLLALFFVQRDYMLPLPNSDCGGALKLRFTWVLPASVKDPGGQASFPPPACTYWTEHSDRAGLDDWCATLGVGDAERGFLGGWAVKTSTDAYARTACRVVENLQRLAASYTRKTLGGAPDDFGEEPTLLGVRKHPLDQCLIMDLADTTVHLLTVADPRRGTSAGTADPRTCRPPLPPRTTRSRDEAEDDEDKDEEETRWDSVEVYHVDGAATPKKGLSEPADELGDLAIADGVAPSEADFSQAATEIDQ